MIASREDLARQAVARAAAVRDRFDIGLTAAVNVIDLCLERYRPKIPVRFKDISMEGLYLREPNPEIWIGLRPLVRRVYNVAHELGHHEFGHGSTFDELQAEGATPLFVANEYLANTFALPADGPVGGRPTRSPSGGGRSKPRRPSSASPSRAAWGWGTRRWPNTSPSG